MKIRENILCPLELTHDILRGKWKPMILWTLRQGEMSPADLERSIDGITQKVLFEQLEELHQYSMVHRRKAYGYPLSTMYKLTDRGEKALAALSIMQEIGRDILEGDTHKKVCNIQNK